jgi:hypothetical protein
LKAKIQFVLEKSPSFESERYCPADRILNNEEMVQLLSLKLETKGEEATISFLESLGCSDVEAILQQMRNP